MKILLVRHSFAGDETDEQDPDRKLTPEGVQIVKDLATWMSNAGEVPNSLFTSPAPRARQTASVLHRELGLLKPRVEDGLGPNKGSSLASVLRRIAIDDRLKRVAIVSHHDTIEHSLAALNEDKPTDLERMAMGELRILKLDRDTGRWSEKDRILPSELGNEDHF